jgi:hypothetical protein
MYKNSVRTPQETHCVSATNINRLMPFRKTNVLYFEKHSKNAVCRIQSSGMLMQAVHNHWALKELMHHVFWFS